MSVCLCSSTGGALNQLCVCVSSFGLCIESLRCMCVCVCGVLDCALG